MPDDDVTPEVEELYDSFLEGVESGTETDFESFVARHRAAEADLRRLHDDWSRLQRTLDEALPQDLIEESFFRAASVRTGPSAARIAGARIGPGSVLDDYRLVRRIGKGGMGHVWEAEQVSLRRKVALKLIRPGREGEEAARLLVHEARAGGRVQHPGIVTVLAAGEAEGVHFIAQELVGDGYSLADFLALMRSETRLPRDYYEQIARLFLTVAEAVHAAHEAGVLHRDLKPQNILIDPEDRPRVSDFGLASVAGDERSRERGLVGTYPYMAPELVDGQRAADRRSDVFSLGAVLYEALTLRRAFEGDSAEQILDRLLHDEPSDPRAVRSRVPADLAVICLTALEKSPSKRYRDMRALADDLRRFLVSEPIRARPQGPVVRLVKWARRHPGRSTGAVLGAVAMLVITALLVREVDLRRDADDARLRAERLAREAGESAALAARRADDALRQSYLARIRAAALDLERDQPAQALVRLSGCPEQLRGWEWHHLALRAGASRLELAGGTAPVAGVAASSDGSLLAAGDRAGVVRLWDGATGEPIARWAGHAGGVESLAMTPGGTVVVAGDASGTVHVWDVGAGRARERRALHDGPVRAVAVDRAGTRIASASDDGRALVWSPGEEGRVVVEATSAVPGVEPVAVALNGDGSELVTAARLGPVRIWDTATGEGLLTLGWYDHVAVAMSDDGLRVAAGREDGRLAVWDARDGGLLVSVEAHASAIASLALSGDGSRLVSSAAGDPVARVWNGRTGAAQTTLAHDGGGIVAVGLSLDGETIVGGGTGGRLRVWDGATRGAVVARDAGHALPTALAVAEVGSLVVSASLLDRDVFLWDGRRGVDRALLSGHRAGVTSLAVSSDGSLVASGSYDGTVRLWDGTRGAARGVLGGHGLGITSVAVSGDGRLVVSAGHDRAVRFWDGATAAARGGPVEYEAVVTSLALSADGRRLVMGAEDGSLRLVDELLAARSAGGGGAAEGEPARGPLGGRLLRPGGDFDDGVVALSADGRRVARASLHRDRIELWDVGNGQPLPPLVGVREAVSAVALSPDGSRVVSASSGDGTLHLWDGATGAALAELTGHDGDVTAVAFAAGGARIVSVGRDGRLRVWESRLEALRPLWRAEEGR